MLLRLAPCQSDPVLHLPPKNWYPMTPERWQKLKDVCNLALEREPAERSSFVAKACGGDQELHREVESMIARATMGGGVLDGPIWKDFAAESSIPTPETIGSYRILRVIGEGG